MKTQALFASCFLSLTVFLQAQTDLSLVSAAGMEFGDDRYHITASLGEPIVETFRTHGIIYTQGFHQTYGLKTQVIELESPGIALKIFPNPCMDFLFINIHEELSGQTEPLIVIAHDMLGKIHSTSSFEAPFPEQIKIQTASWPAGVYFLNLSRSSGKTNHAFKIVKL